MLQRCHFGDWHVAIDAPDRVADRGRQPERISGRAYDNAHSTSHILQRVDIERWFDRLAQSTLADVADHADDFDVRLSDAENLSDRALVRPVAPRQFLVRDEHDRSSGAIACEEFAACSHTEHPWP